MTLEELIQEFRNKTTDTKVPYLWSDDEIIGYANDAEQDACRRAHLLIDSSGEAAQAPVYANDPLVELDDRVISVRRARMASSSIPLAPKTVRSMDDAVPGWDSATPSSPVVFIPDWQTGSLYLFPPSSTDSTMMMTVARLPMNDMVKMKDKPEIKPRYHKGLVNGMLYRGYIKQDADTFDKAKAEFYEMLFIQEFGQKNSALDEQWSFEQYYGIGEL